MNEFKVPKTFCSAAQVNLHHAVIMVRVYKLISCLRMLLAAEPLPWHKPAPGPAQIVETSEKPASLN